MPSSRWYNIPDIINVLNKVRPKSVLDVGCGFGKWGFLAREYSEIWRGHYYKKDWETRIDAVEIFPDYIQSWHREIYDNIYIGDILDLSLGPYDLILAIDVIEHLPDDKVDFAIDKLKSLSSNLVISVPLGDRPQGTGFGNEFETHRSTWGIDRLKKYSPDSVKVVNNLGLAVWYGKPKCIIASENDWANLGYLLARSLQSAGVNAKATTAHRHPFGYKEEAELCPNQLYAEYTATAEVVIAMHSVYKPCNYKRLWVFHGGTAYRHHKDAVNKFFNPIVEGTLIQHLDDLGLGATNEHWLPPPIDLSVEPDYTYHGTKFAHYPRGPNKGTPMMIEAFGEVGIPLTYDTQQVSYPDNLKRMAECDIYINEIRNTVQVWGMTALEAAAMGKIVVANFGALERYEKEYGKCELVVANSKDELKERIKEIYEWTPEQILEKKKATRKWAETYHSFEAIGKRLREIIGL